MDASGATFHVEESGTPIFLGGRVAILTQARDITERKEAERELARAQALLAAAIEQTPAGIIIADAPDAVIRMANSAALDMGGLVEADLQRIRMLGRSARWRVFHPDGGPCPPDAQPLIRAVKEGVTSQNVELIAREGDGTERWILANAAPVRNTDGEIIAGVVVFPEITGLKQTEQRAREQHEQLIQAAKMASLGTLVAGMAHEINNPNTFIMANAPVAGKNLAGPDSGPGGLSPAPRSAGLRPPGLGGDQASGAQPAGGHHRGGQAGEVHRAQPQGLRPAAARGPERGGGPEPGGGVGPDPAGAT